MTKNGLFYFAAGALLRTPTKWAHDASRDLLVSWGGGKPFPTSHSNRRLRHLVSLSPLLHMATVTIMEEDSGRTVLVDNLMIGAWFFDVQRRKRDETANTHPACNTTSPYY